MSNVDLPKEGRGSCIHSGSVRHLDKNAAKWQSLKICMWVCLFICEGCACVCTHACVCVYREKYTIVIVCIWAKDKKEKTRKTEVTQSADKPSI